MRSIRYGIPAASALAFSTTGCVGVDKLTEGAGFSETEVGDGEAPGDSSTGGQGLSGEWDGTEIGGITLPQVYEYAYDDIVYTSTTWLLMRIGADYAGELITYQEYSYTQGAGETETEQDSYSYDISASGNPPDFVIAATGGDNGSTILLDCTMTDADTLDCSYSVDGDQDSDYTIGFARR